MGIIAGVGTREYYKKSGYVLEGTYMVKNLTNQYNNYIKLKIFIIIIWTIIIGYLLYLL